MPSLYEIDKAITDCVDQETGEIIDIASLNALQIERTLKVENVALWIKNLESDALAFKAEKEAFEEREKRAAKKVEGLKQWLAFALNGQQFSTKRCEISFRRSERVVVNDETLLPPTLRNQRIEYTPNKVAIKELLKSGVEVAGCQLVEKINPTIK